MSQYDWRNDKCPSCGTVCIGRIPSLDERTCGKHWWKWSLGEKNVIREVGGMDHSQMQVELNRLTAGMEPEQILSRFEAAGWHSHKFIHMGVIAVNPFHADFSLGITGKWLGIRKPVREIGSGEAWLIWVYPDESFTEVFK